MITACIEFSDDCEVCPIKKAKKGEQNNGLIIKFNIPEIINFDDEYELQMVSFCLAYNDLWHIGKEMLVRSSKEYASYRMFLLKSSIAHLRQAYWLLHQSFLSDTKISEKLMKIDGAYPLFEDISNILNGNDKNSFAYEVLSESRNLTWHYSFGKQSDIDLLKQIADEMNSNNVLGQIIIGQNTATTYFQFADDLLINMIVTLGEKYGLNLEEYFEKIISLLTKVLAPT